jgi:hypothetical protein
VLQLAGAPVMIVSSGALLHSVSTTNLLDAVLNLQGCRRQRGIQWNFQTLEHI